MSNVRVKDNIPPEAWDWVDTAATCSSGLRVPGDVLDGLSRSEACRLVPCGSGGLKPVCECFW